MKKLNYLIALFCISIVLWSCSSPVLYEAIDTIPNGSWDKAKLFEYEFTVSDTSQFYDLIFSLTHGEEYRNANLWLFIKIIAPDGKVQDEKIECVISTPDGHWLGAKQWFSPKRELLIRLKEAIIFPQVGIYKIQLVQGMRYDQLEEIYEVGLKVQEYKYKD